MVEKWNEMSLNIPYSYLIPKIQSPSGFWDLFFSRKNIFTKEFYSVAIYEINTDSFCKSSFFEVTRNRLEILLYPAISSSGYSILSRPSQLG